MYHEMFTPELVLRCASRIVMRYAYSKIIDEYSDMLYTDKETLLKELMKY